MLYRRSRKKFTSDYVPSTSDSLMCNPPLSVVTDRQTLPVSITRIPETEPPKSSPQSRTASPSPPFPQPQITPLVSDRPPPPLPGRCPPSLPDRSQQLVFPDPPRGIGGFRRPSIRCDTHETSTSALQEHAPTSPQPPSMPLPQVPGHSYAQTQQPGQGGGSGKPPAATPFHNKTANYSYRLDTTPSARSNPDSPQYKPAALTGDVHAKIWPTYNKISKEFDSKMLGKSDTDLDVLLIFAALFSTIVTSFLIKALDDLSPNYQQQSTLLLYQLLNGRDPSLENTFDPTVPFRPSGLAVAVVFLWATSLGASLGASFGAMICKEWLTDYQNDANLVVGLIRACQRHVRYMALQRWGFHGFVALLPSLLHLSVFLFAAGAAAYLQRINDTLALVCQIGGGSFAILYFISIFAPFVINTPFRPYPTLVFHRISVAIAKGVIYITDPFVRGCYLVLRYVTNSILMPLARVVVGSSNFQRWCMDIPAILPAEYKPLQVWWANALDDSPDKINTSQKVQEEAILWLSQMPLDPSESEAVFSSLAPILASRTHGFPKPAIVFLNLILESSINNDPSQEQTDSAIDCILVLARIKFRSVVDQNLDHDYSIGGATVTPSVAWTAQQLAADAFRAKYDRPGFEGVRARLLAAAAWLSPVEVDEDVEWNGEKLKIQDRFPFIEEIKAALERHTRNEKPLDNEVLIDLIHGMHACIPRGNYGTPSSIISFLPIFCNDYESPWSEDEAVLGSMITYALDLLSPPGRWKPLVEREIEFGKLASELIDTLMINTNAEVAAFAFWLMYRIPYAFKSRNTLLTDIAHIWTSRDAVISDGARERMNFHAVEAFVAIAQFHADPDGGLSKFTPHTALGLLKAGLGYGYSRAMATYAVAMILNLGTPSQVATFTSGIVVESFRKALFDEEHRDIENDTMEEDDLDLRIYSVLVLLKFGTVELDIGEVKTLIGEVDRAIGDDIAEDESGVARNSGAEVDPDLNRVRWKAVYLSGLLYTFLPEDEKQGLIEGFREKVQALVRNEGLSLAGDYRRCVEFELSAPIGKQGPTYTAFEDWIDDFPLLPLAGSVKTSRASTRSPSISTEASWYRCFCVETSSFSNSTYFVNLFRRCYGESVRTLILRMIS